MLIRSVLLLAVISCPFVMADVCDIDGVVRYESVERFDGGLGLGEPSSASWVVEIDGRKVRWEYSDIVEVGEMLCHADLTFFRFGRQRFPVFSDEHTIELDGVVYRSASMPAQ